MKYHDFRPTVHRILETAQDKSIIAVWKYREITFPSSNHYDLRVDLLWPLNSHFRYRKPLGNQNLNTFWILHISSSKVVHNDRLEVDLAVLSHPMIDYVIETLQASNLQTNTNISETVCYW